MLTATLDLDNHPFIAAMRAANNAVERLQDRITKFTAAFAGLYAAGNAVQQVFGKMQETLELGGTLADMSSETGETISDLVLFRQLLNDVRLGAEGVDKIFPKWTKALAGVNEEGKPTTKTLRELGLSAEQLVGVPIIEQIEILGAAFRAIEDPVKRSEYAMDLFGKSGTKMLAALTNPEALAQARGEVGGFGAQMERTAGTFDAFGDTLGALSLRFHEFMAGVLEVITPALQGVADGVNGINFEALGYAAGYVALALIKVIEALTMLWPILAGFAAQWAASAIAARIAAVSITSSIGGIVTATVTGVRSILAALGPVGIAVTALTFLWQKWRDQAGAKIDLPALPDLGKTSSLQPPSAAGAAQGPVSALARIGGSMFGGAGAFDPVVSEQRRTNEILTRIGDRLASNRALTVDTLSRPDLPI